MAAVAGLFGGLAGSLMRGFTISLDINGLTLGTVVYFLIGWAMACCQLRAINIVMENYDQIKASPIYESSLILNNIICGIIILNERRNYAPEELFILFLCGLVVATGSALLVSSPKHVRVLKGTPV